MDWPRIARLADAALVTVLVVSAQLSVWTAEAGALAGDRPVHALLLAVVTVPLYVRRYRPLAVLLLVLGATWMQFELGGQAFQPWFAVVLSLYALGAHADRRSLLVGCAVTAAVILALDVPRLVGGDPVDDVVPGWVVLAGTAALGRWIRHRRRESRELARRAEAAEHTRTEHAARAVSEERARIARELHDLVAHSMGVIVIQAQAGQRAVDTDPAAVRDAFAAIETTGRQGLAEMRRLLHLLTTADGPSVAPQPSLRELDELVARVQAAGVPVEVERDGDLAQLPAGVDLAAYRIVQEALTNVLKHAGPARVTVRLRLAAGALDVEVRDDGTPLAGAPAGGGHGLVGMTERASLYGGSLETGHLPGGGFRVHARLSLDGAPG